MAKKRVMNDIERDLLEGFEGLLTALKKDRPLAETLTCRRIALNLAPRRYTAERVKATRRLLHVSQTLFAHFLGVSVKTVRAWEQGRAPSDIASRFMDEIQHNPDYWRRRLQESAKAKAC